MMAKSLNLSNVATYFHTYVTTYNMYQCGQTGLSGNIEPRSMWQKQVLPAVLYKKLYVCVVFCLAYVDLSGSPYSLPPASTCVMYVYSFCSYARS